MIKSLITLFTCILIYCSATHAQGKSNEQLKGVYLITTFPFPLITNDIDQTSDTIGFFYRNDTVLMRHGYINSNSFFKDGEQITHSTIQYRYFLFKQGEKSGFWMENERFSEWKLNDNMTIVDTVLKRFSSGIQKPLAELLRDSAKLVQLSVTPEFIKKTYVFTHHQHSNSSDTISLEFNKDFIDIPYHLSNYMDMPNKMKLFKYSMVNFCGEAMKDTYPEFAVMRMGAYLSKPDPATSKEAEKYLQLASDLAK